MYPRNRPAVIVFLLLPCLPMNRAAAQERVEDLPSTPAWTVRLVDGDRLTGRLERIDPGGTLAIQPADAEAPARSLSLGQVVSLDRLGAPAVPSLPESSFLLFPDGDRLRGSPVRADEAHFVLAMSGVGPVDVPIGSVLGWVATPPAEPEALEAIVRAIRGEPGGQEVLWLANGDRLEGSYSGLTADHLEFQSRVGESRPARKEVRALAFDPKLVEYPQTRRPYLECLLLDGSRLALADLRYSQGELTAKTRFGASIRLPITEVGRLVVRSDAVEYLSERSEDAVKTTGYLGKPRPYQRDASAEGRPIRLHGRPFDRGLGMQARTLLAYKLDASAERFQATIGLDDRAGPLGSVVFRVRLDDRELFASPPMTDGLEPIDVDVSVRGGRFLILEADFGDRGDVRDLADWADARLILGKRDRQ